MIKRLNTIKDFGIFGDGLDISRFNDFNRFNLIYGLNGSGKSTLSHLFSLVENPNIEKRFLDSKWSFQLLDGQLVSESTTKSGVNIRVFDRSFVENNINWDDTIKGILIVSETKKEEIEKRNQKKIELKKIESKIDQLGVDLFGDEKKKKKKGLIYENSNFLTKAAKGIKEKFQLIDVKDTYLSNYNKIKLETALLENKVKIQKKQLSISDIEKLSESIKPQDKEQLNLIELTGLNQLQNQREVITDILKKTVTSIILENLKNSPEKSEWAKLGLELHEENDVCSFCGNTVTKKRIQELDNFFSESYKKLKEQIEETTNWAKTFEFPQLQNKLTLYKEFQEEYSRLVDKIKVQIVLIQEILDEWKGLLELKDKDPFSEQEAYVPSISIIEIHDFYTQVNKIISSHNQKFKNLDSTIKEAKSQLEIEYIKTEIKRYNYFQHKSDQLEKTELLDKTRREKESLEREIKELNDAISTETLGAEKFNKDLWKFLGRRDIELVPMETGGYKVQRNKDPFTKGKFLSEGEKMAIAFVYFSNKVKEDENKIQDTIIVVDDPVSSFDSNNLFNSYSFLKLNFNESKQLFVLTHNFNYFRLVRDWFESKNKKQIDKHRKNNELQKSVCNFYHIESKFIKDSKRVSQIINADDTLLHYTSEYHYQFNKLLKYSKENNVDLDFAYLSANAARKISETFLRFKFPQKVHDFRNLFSKGIAKTTLKEKEESLYKFINKYSHAQDFDNDSSDNQLGEGGNIAIDILQIIKELDKEHYNEMVELCEAG